MQKLSVTSFALLLLCTACEQIDSKGKPLQTPTSGSIHVMVDEGYKPIIASSIDVFDSIYRLAHVTATYTSEGAAIKALLDDSVQVIIITRQLNEAENNFFKVRGYLPKSTPIAYDALAFIMHPSNPDSALTVQQLRDILTGKAKNWKDINPSSKLGNLRLVFDNPLSGIVRYAKDSIGGGAPLTDQASALQTNEEVINYVAKNKNAIGIIAANWISDTDDKGVQKFLSEIHVVDVAAEAGKEAFGPYQVYMQLGNYPFRRTVYIINAQPRNGLGLGFASYLAGPDGQRIVLKDGMLPASMPPRIIRPSRK